MLSLNVGRKKKIPHLASGDRRENFLHLPVLMDKDPGITTLPSSLVSSADFSAGSPLHSAGQNFHALSCPLGGALAKLVPSH